MTRLATILLLLCAGCATERPNGSTSQQVQTKLAALMPPAVESRAQGSAVAPQGQSVTLKWDASQSTNVAGYYIYYGQDRGSYPTRVDVGNTTSATLNGLPKDPVWFAATAYNIEGEESAFSNDAAVIGVQTEDVVYAQTNRDLVAGQWSDSFKVLATTNSAPDNFYRLRVERTVKRIVYP